MIELRGKYSEAKIFTDQVDEASISQVMNLLNSEFVAGSQIRMMPDIHAGAGCTIGTTMTIHGKVCPNLVGVDIGCGMLVYPLHEKEIDMEKLDAVIHERIPAGFAKRSEPHWYLRPECVDTLLREIRAEVDIPNAELSLGTLGGGNHFIEVDKDDDGNLYLVIHTGSRHLGLEVANHYQKLAGGGPLDYLEGQGFDDYIHDMKLVQRYACCNRFAIADDILRYAGIHSAGGFFETVHNYIDTENMILRKGSVSAAEGERLIIPINMRDGSLICIGKGNPDWNYSAPHGAGRLFSRGEAKRRFTIDEYENEMEGIYTTSVSQSTLDECPMAYKSMDSILANIGDTADVVSVIKPIYNFKA